MSTKIDIYNLALYKIAQSIGVPSVHDESKAADVLNRLWEPVRDIVLTDRVWPWAMKAKALSLEAERPLPGWNLRYAYPNDCLTAYAVTNEQGIAACGKLTAFVGSSRIGRHDWETAHGEQGMSIVTNVADAWLVYAAKIEDASLYPPQFVNALACRLAAEAAPPLLGDLGLQAKQALLDEYAVALTHAGAHSMNEARNDAEGMTPSLAARGGGGFDGGGSGPAYVTAGSNPLAPPPSPSVPPYPQKGESAYQIARDHGFQGSETEWLASLKGEKGDRGEAGPEGPEGKIGPPGPRGLIGPKGDTGPQGAEGPQGIQGPQGPRGDDGQDGAGIEIAGSVDGYGDLPDDLGPDDSGSGYLVRDDGKLYIWDGSGFPASGAGVDFRGPRGPEGPEGPQGPQGPAGSITPEAQAAMDAANQARDQSVQAAADAGQAKEQAITARNEAVPAASAAASARDEAEGFAEAADTARSQAQAAQSAAQSSASAAQAAAGEASTKASEASSSAASAASARTVAEAARDLAEQYADAPVDVEVAPGKYSARHWAETTQADLGQYTKTADLGSAAFQAATAFATAAQGAKADSAVQHADLEDYPKTSSLGSAAFVAATSFATAGQVDELAKSRRALGYETGIENEQFEEGAFGWAADRSGVGVLPEGVSVSSSTAYANSGAGVLSFAAGTSAVVNNTGLRPVSGGGTVFLRARSRTTTTVTASSFRLGVNTYNSSRVYLGTVYGDAYSRSGNWGYPDGLMVARLQLGSDVRFVSTCVDGSNSGAGSVQLDSVEIDTEGSKARIQLTDMVVRIPQDYANLQAAIDDLSLRHMGSRKIIELRLDSGQRIASGIYVSDGDYSQFRVTATGGPVKVSTSWPSDRSFCVGYRARMPNLACVIDMEGRGDTGYGVYRSSVGHVEDGAGVINAGKHGMETRGSTTYAAHSIWTGAGETGIRAQQASTVSAEGANVSNAGHRGLYASRGSVVQFMDANAQNCGNAIVEATGSGGVVCRRSHVVAEGANVSGSYNGIYATGASTVAAAGLIANNCGSDGARIAHGSRLDADGAQADGCVTRAFRAEFSATISVRNGQGTVTGSSNVVSAEVGSFVSVQGFTVNGAAITASNVNVAAFNALTANGAIFN